MAAERVKMHLFGARQNALIRSLWWLELLDLEVGLKEDIGFADEMALLVLGYCAHSACNCARGAAKCTFSQFMVAGIIGFGRKSA